MGKEMGDQSSIQSGDRLKVEKKNPIREGDRRCD